jgi:zinc transport system substrate-binding protein
MRRAPLLLVPGVAAVGLLSACGSATGNTAADGATAGTISVVTSFYPVEFAVQQIGGSHVSVSSLTKPGTEPHDLELTPKDVGRVAGAALVVYAKGFQPAVDTAVEQEATDHALDVAPTANLDLAAPAEEDGRPGPIAGHTDATDPADPAEPADRDAAKDPHFWLDPQRYAAVATAIAQRLGQVDPANAAAFTDNATAFTAKLATLDGEFRTTLASCARKELVTSHAAFGYLSERYGLTQVAIAGLSPDVEPSGAQLAEVADFVKAHGVTTIYAETLVEPAFAETVVRSTGARLATLDPIEGLTSSSAGRDYLEVMRANLATLEAGQGCPA